MAEYRYAGPGPEEHEGELARPGDVRAFSEEPGWGAWVPVDDPEADAPPAAPPAATPSEGTEGGV